MYDILDCANSTGLKHESSFMKTKDKFDLDIYEIICISYRLVDYLGLFSILFTICFVAAFMSCYGYLFKCRYVGTFTMLGTSGLLKFVSSFRTFYDFWKSFYKNKKRKQSF